MRTNRLLRAGAALVLVLVAGGVSGGPARAAQGTVTITGTNDAVTANYPFGGVAETEFFLRCRERLAAGNAGSGDSIPAEAAVPITNGQGAWVVDLGSEITGTFSATATVAPAPLGPPLPDPTQRLFPSGSYQLYSYDLDIHFATSNCDDAGTTASTQNPNEVGSPARPARYMIIVLAFNATGSPSITVNYSTP